MGEPGRCKQTVFGERVQSWQCARRAWRDGYCKQHHPETVKARDAASRQRWAAQQSARDLARKRGDLQVVVAWLAKRAPGSGLHRRAQDELAKLSPVSAPQGEKE